MGETVDLLPCPFCGGKAKYESILHVDPVIGKGGAYVDADMYYFEKVYCTVCGAEIQLGEDEADDTTIEKWNSRMISGKRHGSWQRFEGTLTCSECGAEYYDAIMELCGDDVPHFCPNCGADMSEKGEYR